jgi:hypothetical protein
MQPKIGIWWDDGRTIVALAHSPKEKSSRGGLIDSELSHLEQWPNVAARFALTSQDDYYDVPRGRVLLHRRTGEGLICHGNSTSQTRLRKIAAFFQLTTWTALRKTLYDMSPDTDALSEEN